MGLSLFADFFGIDNATLTILVGALGGFFAWFRSVVNSLVTSHKTFLSTMSENDGKRIEILNEMKVANVQTKDAINNLTSEVGDVKDDVHVIKTDIAVIKDRFAERASSTSIPRIPQPQGN